MWQIERTNMNIKKVIKKILGGEVKSTGKLRWNI